jgi:hypothetical protein
MGESGRQERLRTLNNRDPEPIRNWESKQERKFQGLKRASLTFKLICFSPWIFIGSGKCTAHLRGNKYPTEQAC